MESCCTCASILSSTPHSAPESEKPFPQDRRVSCCARVICGKCLQENNRFASYCPFCQISSGPSSLPQGLRDPPSYTSVPLSNTQTTELAGAPPPYTRLQDPDDEKAALHEKPIQDILHFLNHEYDTIASLSLRYNVPPAALRRLNNLTSDHLLLARRTILIPGEFYKAGVSLSPRPVEGEEEEARKGKIRRFMTGCKVSDYDVALLYLEQSGYDLEMATDVFWEDEKWEREHPQKWEGKKKRGLFGRVM